LRNNVGSLTRVKLWLLNDQRLGRVWLYAPTADRDYVPESPPDEAMDVVAIGNRAAYRYSPEPR